MHITYENDTERGPGHGILRCQAGEGERFPEGSCTLALERSSDHFFLGANDWGGQKSFLAIDTERTEAGTLLLLLGPDIIDRLDAQEKYRAHVQGADGSTCKPATFCPEGLIVSPAGTPGRVAAAATAQPEVPKPPPPPPTPPESPPEPPPETPPVVAPPLEKPIEEAPRFDEPEVREAPKKDRSLLWVVIVALVLLLLLAGAGAAWYFLKGRTPKPPPVEPSPTATTPVQVPTPQAAASQTTEDRVRAFFAGNNRTPPAAAALSRELPKESAADQDAVYRLYYFAGERGESSVLMDYAACLDPGKPQWGSIGKDAPAAWDIYEKAKATHPEAAQAQQNLKTWLQQEAASGNAQAVGWLRQIQ